MGQDLWLCTDGNAALLIKSTTVNNIQSHTLASSVHHSLLPIMLSITGHSDKLYSQSWKVLKFVDDVMFDLVHSADCSMRSSRHIHAFMLKFKWMKLWWRLQKSSEVNCCLGTRIYAVLYVCMLLADWCLTENDRFGSTSSIFSLLLKNDINRDGCTDHMDIQINMLLTQCTNDKCYVHHNLHMLFDSSTFTSYYSWSQIEYKWAMWHNYWWDHHWP